MVFQSYGFGPVCCSAHNVSLTQTNDKNVILNRYSSLFRVNLHGVPQGLI